MSSLHISAATGEIAKTVLMPGDPMRAKAMSEKYLSDIKQINNIRGMLGYTGVYKGKSLTIMGSGMGVPSIGIYSYELFNFYGVENIIRVGTCGAIQERLNLKDIIITQAVSHDSNFISQFNLSGSYSPTSSWTLLRNAVATCEKLNIKYEVGNVLCTDIFYHANPHDWKRWSDLGVLGIEMESVALYANAARAGKNAITILTVSDQIIREERSTPEERQNYFFTMFEVALESTLL